MKFILKPYEGIDFFKSNISIFLSGYKRNTIRNKIDLRKKKDF